MANILRTKIFNSRLKLFSDSHLNNISEVFIVLFRNFVGLQTQIPNYLYFNNGFEDETDKSKLVTDLKVLENFITEEEENCLLKEIEPQIKRLRYEKDHWDNAIKGYRETEKQNWNSANAEIIERVRKVAFQPGTVPLKYVHVLDLEENGAIMPHIDSVRFCGTTIAGISLLTDSVMRLIHDKDKTKVLDILLKRRSLYIMTGTARYDYTHEILGNENSKFGDVVVKKSRRISVICRNEP